MLTMTRAAFRCGGRSTNKKYILDLDMAFKCTHEFFREIFREGKIERLLLFDTLRLLLLFFPVLFQFVGFN